MSALLDWAWIPLLALSGVYAAIAVAEFKKGRNR